MRKPVFYFALAFVFLRFSMFHQVVTYVVHQNLYLMYLLGIPVLLGALLSGALQSTMRSRVAWLWIGFGLWMIMATPFSFWRGGSAQLVWRYFRTELPMLVIIGGLVFTWRECRVLLSVLAASGVVNLLSVRLFSRNGERLSLEIGTVANANDLAAHLLLVLPFLLWVGMDRKRAWVLRLGAFAGVTYGVYVMLSTASRGAVVAIAVVCLYALWRGNIRQRAVLLLGGPIGIVILLAVVPEGALERIRSFAGSDAQVSNVSRGALESSAIRERMLRLALEYTLDHPLFGVGPGQFSTVEGTTGTAYGTHGYWQAAHNSFMAVFSECGIPAGILYLGAVIGTFRLLSSTHRKARQRPDCREIASALFCIRMGYLGFVVAITFLNFAYMFYMPAMTGMAIAVARAAAAEFQRREPAPDSGVTRLPALVSGMA